jgi:hypothetical protein
MNAPIYANVRMPKTGGQLNALNQPIAANAPAIRVQGGRQTNSQKKIK